MMPDSQRVLPAASAQGRVVRVVTMIAVLLYAATVGAHLICIMVGSDLTYPSKLMLMPCLIVAASLYAVRVGAWRSAPYTVSGLLIGGALSWLGDGAAFFFPTLPELPMMLVCFGAAHLCYIVVIWRTPGLAIRGIPNWAWWYVAAYVALMVLLWPHTGALQIPVLCYGLLLLATAAMTSRCGATVAWGGGSFLLSDALLAVSIFMPSVLPEWSGFAVMLSYTVGQGLIILGLLHRLALAPGLLGGNPR